MLFGRVHKLLDNIIALDENQLINEVLSNREFQKFIIDLNTEGQLREGVNSLGVSLSSGGREYSELTMKISARKGRPKRSISLVDLHDTGDFYKSFRIVIKPKSFAIEAETDKGDTDLLQRYGKDVLGLTDEHLQLVIDALRKKIIPIIKNKIYS
jgi:hypothetical protein